eukprot:Pgem_evm1s77
MHKFDQNYKGKLLGPLGPTGTTGAVGVGLNADLIWSSTLKKNIGQEMFTCFGQCNDCLKNEPVDPTTGWFKCPGGGSKGNNGGNGGNGGNDANTLCGS